MKKEKLKKIIGITTFKVINDILLSQNNVRQILIQQKFIKILYQIQLLISLHHNKFLD